MEQKIAEHLRMGQQVVSDACARALSQFENKVDGMRHQFAEFASNMQHQIKEEIERSVSTNSGLQIPQIVEEVFKNGDQTPTG
jgi:hypothetical protein